MKKIFWITLWCVGMLIGCLWLALIVFSMIHLHRVTFGALFLLWGDLCIIYISFRYLREELGGPAVEFKQQEILSPESLKKLRSLWR